MEEGIRSHASNVCTESYRPDGSALPFRVNGGPPVKTLREIIALTAAAATLCQGSASAERFAPDIGKWKIGIQTYTFRSNTFEEAVEKTADLGLTYVEAYPGQQLNTVTARRIFAARVFRGGHDPRRRPFCEHTGFPCTASASWVSPATNRAREGCSTSQRRWELRSSCPSLLLRHGLWSIGL